MQTWHMALVGQCDSMTVVCAQCRGLGMECSGSAAMDVATPESEPAECLAPLLCYGAACCSSAAHRQRAGSCHRALRHPQGEASWRTFLLCSGALVHAASGPRSLSTDSNHLQAKQGRAQHNWQPQRCAGGAAGARFPGARAPHGAAGPAATAVGRTLAVRGSSRRQRLAGSSGRAGMVSLRCSQPMLR